MAHLVQPCAEISSTKPLPHSVSACSSRRPSRVATLKVASPSRARSCLPGFFRFDARGPHRHGVSIWGRAVLTCTAE